MEKSSMQRTESSIDGLHAELTAIAESGMLASREPRAGIAVRTQASQQKDNRKKIYIVFYSDVSRKRVMESY